MKKINKELASPLPRTTPGCRRRTNFAPERHMRQVIAILETSRNPSPSLPPLSNLATALYYSLPKSIDQSVNRGNTVFLLFPSTHNNAVVASLSRSFLQSLKEAIRRV